MYNLLIHLDISKNYLSSLSAMGVESFEALELQGWLKKVRKRVDLNHQVLNTIFSKYLALPIATFPFLATIIAFFCSFSF